MARPLFDSILQQVGGLAAAAIYMSNSCCWRCPQLQGSLHALLLSLQLGSVTLSGPQCLPRITVQRRPRRASRLQSRAQAAGDIELLGLQAAADAKRPLLLERGRYLTPGTDALTDPAYEAYHGIAEASVGKLLAEPGRTSVAFSAAVKLGCQEAIQGGLLPQAGLPAPEPSSNAKASMWCGTNAVHAQVFAW